MVSVSPTVSNPPPLRYAKPDLEQLDISRYADGVTLRIPPLEMKEFAVRIAIWSLAFASLGMSAVLRILDLPASPYTIIFVSYPWFLPWPAAAVLCLMCGYMVVRIAAGRRRPTVVAIDQSGIVLDHPTALIPRRRISV